MAQDGVLSRSAGVAGANLTRLLQEASGGSKSAGDELLNAIYAELRQMAGAKLAHRRPGQTLQPTALVHEAYLRLLGHSDGTEGSAGPAQQWHNRAYFFAAAAEAMRRILVEDARRKFALKRGGGRKRIELDSAIAADERSPSDGISAIGGLDPEQLMALHGALERLQAEDPQKAALVKLRYFAGLTIEQASEALGISHATAERWWAYSRARLFLWISGGAAGDSPAT